MRVKRLRKQEQLHLLNSRAGVVILAELSWLGVGSARLGSQGLGVSGIGYHTRTHVPSNIAVYGPIFFKGI